MNDAAIWSIIHKAWGITAKATKALKLLLSTSSAEEIWGMSESEFTDKFSSVSHELIDKLYQMKAKVDLARIDDNLSKYQIRLINCYDEEYPEKLKNIYDPPVFLYVKGHWASLPLAIAMVGSRKCTSYGEHVALELSRELSQNGVCILSGLARGIDTASHKGAIACDGGTVAILGSGVDVIYPKENQKLYYDILAHEKGAIVSELPLGSAPLKHHFPLRNRIISGLSDGLVIVEAAVKSGALITAELALEQGKEIFVIPGPITSPMSEGAHKLIKDGAKMTTCAADILEEYGQRCLIEKKNVQDKDTPLGEDEQKILDCIGIEPVSVEELAIITKQPINHIVAILSILEIEGLIEQIVGRKYIRLG